MSTQAVPQVPLRTEPRTSEERDRLTVQQIQAVINGLPRNFGAGLFGAAVMAFVAWYGVDASSEVRHFGPALMWWFLISAGLILSAWIAQQFLSTTQPAEATMRFAKWLKLAGFYNGACWGLVPWLLMPTGTEKTNALLMIASAMVLMGSAVSVAICQQWLYLVIVPNTVMLVAGLIWMGDPFHLYTAIAIVLLAFVIVAGAKVQENAVRAAILAGFDTEALLVERIEQQATLEHARMEAESARQAAEIADQGKTTFLAAAGHDLRQPVHALVQYFGHLKRRNADPALDETISRIGKSLDSMQDLLDTILEVSKLMMGSIKPQPTTFEIARLLDRIDAQMRPIAEDKGLRFEVESIQQVVATDEVLLERILRNLTLNAIRYTDSGSVLLRAKQKGSNVFVQVADSGIGIPRDERQRIFEAFYQVSNQARDRRKGLGLGLAIVRQLSELLAVPIRLRSKEHKGSIITVEVGAVLAPQTRIAQHASLVVNDVVKGSSVVLIDDSDESLDATAETLVLFGCHVLTARSGLDAIERLQGQEFVPHLIISDYRLEDGETGLEAISMVIENQRALFGQDFLIPAIVLSGDTAPAELEKVSQAGWPMLHKPVPMELLHQAVNAQLRALAGLPH